jgi:hypothetical protein
MGLRRRAAVLALGGMLAVLGGGAGAQPTDLERLRQCDRDLCAIIAAPTLPGPPLRCDLAATWYKEQIDRAARSKNLVWPFGDIRCTLGLTVERKILGDAVAEPNARLVVPTQTANCEVEYNGARYPIALSLAPEIAFREGRAVSVSLGVKDVEANLVIETLLWSASKLQDSLGLFEQDFVRGVNRYIERQCPSRAGRGRQATLRPDSMR